MSKFFRTLRADEIECRVSACSEKGASLLLYKTARTDADILDEVFGPHRWENDFKLFDGVLYGGIGIDYGDDGKLVWKWDAGTESNTEAEKGRASDAFKRAGFKHGIGRELYSAPFIFIPADKCNIKRDERSGKYKCNDNFVVTEIGYDESEKINSLTISVKGKQVFTMRKQTKTTGEGNSGVEELSAITEKHFPKSKELITCDACDCLIEDIKRKDGTVVTAKQIIDGSKSTFGKTLCLRCAREMKKNLEETA